MLLALDFMIDRPLEIAMVGAKDDPDLHALLSTVHALYLPNKVVAVTPPDAPAGVAKAIPLLAERRMIDGKAAVYVCERFSCKKPMTDKAELDKLLRSR